MLWETKQKHGQRSDWILSQSCQAHTTNVSSAPYRIQRRHFLTLSEILPWLLQWTLVCVVQCVTLSTHIIGAFLVKILSWDPTADTQRCMVHDSFMDLIYFCHKFYFFSTENAWSEVMPLLEDMRKSEFVQLIKNVYKKIDIFLVDSIFCTSQKANIL